MSTRWYPIYGRGCPQLRIFLPNFWLKLVRPSDEQAPNVVKFIVSSQMTKIDVKNYLEKIYNLSVVDVHTANVSGKTRRNPVGGYIIKNDDFKIAFVTLPTGTNFEFPELYPESEEKKKADQSVEAVKSVFKKYLTKAKDRPGAPGWFSF